MITVEMIQSDKSLAISLHREMWNWLADNPLKYKRDWPRWEGNGGDIEDPFNFCFCCIYSEHRDCQEGCPLTWGKLSDDCTNLSVASSERPLRGIYDRWRDCYDNLSKRSQLARAIANLPERIA